MMDLPDRFLRHVRALELGRGPVVLAVSGGPDSLALLDLVAGAAGELGLEPVVAHVDHGIAADSAAVAAAVEGVARRYGLPFRSASLALGAGTSEAAARAGRYAALERVRSEAGARWILTAHHADDQIETVLMRVLDGSGPAGLAGMAARRGAIARPLLPFRRAELARHAADRGLAAWQDPANADPRYLRAWVRSELLPMVERRLPAAGVRLARLASEAAVERRAWDEALDALPGLDVRAEADGISVAAPSLARYDSALSRALIRAAARRTGLVVGARRAGRLLELARTGRSGARVPLGGAWLGELAFGRLRIVCGAEAPPPAPLRLDEPSGELRWGGWLVRWRRESAPAAHARDGTTAWLVPVPLELRAWRPGDRIRPLGGAGRRLVVRCLQDARVPRSRRGGWPVLVDGAGDEVVWAPGVCRSDRLIPEDGTEAVRVDVTDG